VNLFLSGRYANSYLGSSFEKLFQIQDHFLFYLAIQTFSTALENQNLAFNASLFPFSKFQ